MRRLVLCALAGALSLAVTTGAVASAPVHATTTTTVANLFAPGELCSFGVREDAVWVHDQTTFQDGSWLVHGVEDTTMINLDTEGVITAHLNYNVSYDPVSNAGKTKGAFFQVRDADGRVISTTAGLIATDSGAVVKMTPNAVLLSLPHELICEPLGDTP